MTGKASARLVSLETSVIVATCLSLPACCDKISLLDDPLAESLQDFCDGFTGSRLPDLGFAQVTIAARDLNFVSDLQAVVGTEVDYD